MAAAVILNFIYRS